MASRAEQALGRMAALTEGRRFEPAGPRLDHRQLRSAAGAVLLALLIAFTVFVVYGTAVDNRWYKIVAIEGGSMEPAISPGDAIIVTRPPERLTPGMVVLLQVDDKLVTHRVVAVKADGSFTTKGDANEYADDWSGTNVRVAGVQRASIPFLGRLLRIGSGAWLTQQARAPTIGDVG
jgi:signal peptidase I